MENTENTFKVCIKCFTFNHVNYIEDAMHGFVMQQTDFPYVTFIADDASTDGEQDVIKRFLEREFDMRSAQWNETEDYQRVVVKHKTNINCTFVVSFLKYNHYSIKKAKKPYFVEWSDNVKYIALCEGDDYWTDPLKLQRQVDFLEEHEEYSMCCTAFSQTVNGNEEEKTEIVFDLDDIDIHQILEGQWIGTLTVMYRRDLTIDYKPPFPNLPMGDLPLWCHLAKKGKIKYFKEITANYRRLDTSACHFTDEVRQFGFNLDAMRVREYFAKQTDNMDVVRTVFSKNARYMLDVCFSKGYFVPYLGKLWHFISCYGNPSGYDRLKYWGLKSKLNMQIAKMVYNIKKKK